MYTILYTYIIEHYNSITATTENSVPQHTTSFVRVSLLTLEPGCVGGFFLPWTLAVCTIRALTGRVADLIRGEGPTLRTLTAGALVGVVTPAARLRKTNTGDVFQNLRNYHSMSKESKI